MIQRKRRCKCGCGGQVKVGNMFINGHNNKGVSMSSEQADKISLALTGRKLSKSHREKLSKAFSGEKHPLYGKKHASATRLAMSESQSGTNNHFFGKKHTKASLKKIGESCEGDKHWNWQGGKSAEPYCFAWYNRDFKDYVKERDGYKCMNTLCWGTSSNLVIHHIDYNKMNCDPENVITLCRSCNPRAERNRKFWQKHYEGIMKRRK